MVTCNSIVSLKETDRDIRIKVLEKNTREGLEKWDFFGEVVYEDEDKKEGVTASKTYSNNFSKGDEVYFNSDDIETVIES